MMSFDHFDPIPDHLFCVLFVDTSYDGEGNEAENSLLEKRQIETEFSVAVEDVDIHPGASLPAFLLEANLIAPIVAAAITTAFFQGKNIKENFDAWVEIAQGLKRYLTKPVYLNRSAAGALALDKLLSHVESRPKLVRVLRYSTFDNRFGELQDAWDQEESHVLEYHSCLTHVFDFDVDGRKFIVLVEGSDVGIKETK